MTPRSTVENALACPMNDLSSTFGERIRFLRESRNQSLQDVATSVGSSKSHIHELENGNSNNPTLNLIRSLSIHFMVPVTALVETRVTAQYQKATPPRAEVEAVVTTAKNLNIAIDNFLHDPQYGLAFTGMAEHHVESITSAQNTLTEALEILSRFGRGVK